MKKGYHDYIPIIKEEKKEEVKPVVFEPKEPKYIITMGGRKLMISDERGMVVAGTDVLILGNKLPSSYNVSNAKNPYKMNTKDYIKYNGRL